MCVQVSNSLSVGILVSNEDITPLTFKGTFKSASGITIECAFLMSPPGKLLGTSLTNIPFIRN